MATSPGRIYRFVLYVLNIKKNIRKSPGSTTIDVPRLPTVILQIFHRGNQPWFTAFFKKRRHVNHVYYFQHHRWIKWKFAGTYISRKKNLSYCYVVYHNWAINGSKQKLNETVVLFTTRQNRRPRRDIPDEKPRMFYNKITKLHFSVAGVK